jgi:hypothetical protein
MIVFNTNYIVKLKIEYKIEDTIREMLETVISYNISGRLKGAADHGGKK